MNSFQANPSTISTVDKCTKNSPVVKTAHLPKPIQHIKIPWKGTFAVIWKTINLKRTEENVFPKGLVMSLLMVFTAHLSVCESLQDVTSTDISPTDTEIMTQGSLQMHKLVMWKKPLSCFQDKLASPKHHSSITTLCLNHCSDAMKKIGDQGNVYKRIRLIGDGLTVSEISPLSSWWGAQQQARMVLEK